MDDFDYKEGLACPDFDENRNFAEIDIRAE